VAAEIVGYPRIGVSAALYCCDAKKEDALRTLDIRKDLWRSVMFDSHSISTVMWLRKRCGPDMKVIFDGNVPLIVPKTKMDRLLERVCLK
jgi:hypothetical protein